MNSKTVNLHLLAVAEKKMRHEVRVSGKGYTHNHFVMRPRDECGRGTFGAFTVFTWSPNVQNVYSWVLKRNQRKARRKSHTAHYCTYCANPVSALRRC